MGAVPVVLVDPFWKGLVPFRGVLIEPCVGPFADGGLYESFCFSVCAWGIDSGADMSSIEGVALGFEQIGDKAGSVIGHDAAHPDVVADEVSRCLAKEKACRSGFFVGHHGHIGHAGVVVDSNVEELPAGAAGLVLRIAGDAMAWLADASQLLDVDVQQISGSIALVAVGRQLGFEHADFIELEPGEDAADRGPAEAGQLGDLDAGLALPPQLSDALGHGRTGLARRQVWARAKIGQAASAQRTITAHPLGSTLPAEPALGCRLAQAQPAFHNTLCKLLSTVDRQSSMMVIVHSVS